MRLLIWTVFSGERCGPWGPFVLAIEVDNFNGKICIFKQTLHIHLLCCSSSQKLHSYGEDWILQFQQHEKEFPQDSSSLVIKKIFLIIGISTANQNQFLLPLITNSVDSGPCNDYMLPLISNVADYGPCSDNMLPLITNSADSGPCNDNMLPLITNSADSGQCGDYMLPLILTMLILDRAWTTF